MAAPREVFVVMPAFDERDLIGKAMALVPRQVKKLIVVDDGSRDGTPDVAESLRDCRTVILRRRSNGGVGRAIADGYRVFLEEAESGRSVCVVMAGDAQMDPADLPALLAPFDDPDVGYVKGNRLADRRTRASMPLHRNFGTRVLTLLTRIASGYRGIHDSQCGYTAITAEALRCIPLDRLYPRYGYPNDLLIKLGAAGVKVAEAPVRAVYGSERSKLRPARVAPRILLLLLRGFLWRAGFRRPGGGMLPSAGLRQRRRRDLPSAPCESSP